MNRRSLWASVFAGPGPGEANGASADGLNPEQERRAGAIARQTMSPFCPGRTLADCPSNYAAEWRTDIRKMVLEGKSAEEIQRELEGRIGGNLSGSPNRNAGYGVSIFFGVLAFAVLGAVFFRLRTGRSSGASEAKGAAPKPLQNQPTVDEARLEAELLAESGDPDD